MRPGPTVVGREATRWLQLSALFSSHARWQSIWSCSRNRAIATHAGDAFLGGYPDLAIDLPRIVTADSSVVVWSVQPRGATDLRTRSYPLDLGLLPVTGLIPRGGSPSGVELLVANQVNIAPRQSP